MKRGFDILFSITALCVFAAPVFAITALLKWKEKHAVFFRQTRIGLDQKPFQILKFQTLIEGFPTQTGVFLRRTGLDELVQFFNVLKGDMSIVGSRALTAFDIERLGWDDDFHSKRWTVKPGITGFAQLYGGQHRKTSWFFDQLYLKNNNLAIDFMVIAFSFLMNVFGKTRIRRIIFQRKNLK